MKRLLPLLLAIAAALTAWFLWLQERLPSFVEWVQEQGWFGLLIFGLGYAAATVLMIPGALITMLAGVVYGPWLGTAVVSPASVLGASAAFLLGRSVFRAAVERKMADSRRFAALQTAMRREGFKILVLVRLSPIFPYSLVNYAFGITPLSLGAYAFGSWLAMLPGTFLYVYLGSTVGDLALLSTEGAPDAGAAGLIFKIVGLLATVVVTILVTRAARRALAESAPEVARGEGGGTQ